MSKGFRFLVPASAVLIAMLAALMLLPAGASGGDAFASTGSSSEQYYFGESAQITEPVDGTVQVFAGDAVVTAPVRGDLIVAGGDVTIRGAGRVDGNVIYAGGTLTAEPSSIGGRAFSLTSVEGAASTINRSAVAVSLLLVWLIAAVVVTLGWGREVRFSSVEVRASAFHCFALGLVAFTSFVITAIVFSYLVPFLVGVPLLAFLAVFAVATKVYGLIAVFHAVGSLVVRARRRDELASARWFRGDLAMVVVGVVILGAIRLVPVIGPIVWSCASLFGIGCALATRFGRREPAFLAWRPAEA